MYTIFSSRFILLICIAEATIPFDPLHTHLLTMEMGDLKASRLGQWSHLGWFKLRQHVTFVLSETPSGTTLPSEYMSELGASPESRLREGDLSVGSLLGGVLLTSCWESERYRIQAVIQSSEDLNQLWSGAWPLELIQTGAGLPGSWTYTWLLLPTHPLVITSGPLSETGSCDHGPRDSFQPGHHPEGLQATVTPTWGVLQYLSDMARSLPSIRADHCQKLICPKLSGLGFSLVFFPLLFPFLPPFYQPLIDALLCSRYTLMRSRNSDIFKKGFSACSKASVQIKRQTRQQNGQWWWPVELKK